jgi:peptide/nickel transport system permease protein
MSAFAEGVSGRVRQGSSALQSNWLLSFGLAVIVILILVALLAPVLAPYPHDAGTATHPFQTLRPPSGNHWFGTDQLGRDVFSRVLFASRVSLRIVFVVLLIAAVIGVPLGLIAGYFGGIVDDIIMRVTDVFLAFPALLLALALATVLTPSVGNATIAIAVTWWPWYARIVRGQAASIARRPYIESSQVLGVPAWRIIMRHVLPNSVTPVLVQISLDAGGVLLTAAGLSFLGLGAQDPTPEWGLMVSTGRDFFFSSWWVITFPGLAIVVAALGFNLVGDGLREVLDPKRVLTR